MHRVLPSSDAHRGRPLDRRRLLGGAGGAALALAAMASGLRVAPSAARARTHSTEGDDAPRDAISPLLAMVPASVAADAIGSGPLFFHADLKAQFAAHDVDRTDPGWIDAGPIAPMTMPLALMSPAFQYGLTDAFPDLFGFRPFELDRALDTGVPPETFSLLQGAFDRERLEAAWAAAGYASVALDDGLTLWTKGEDGRLDMKDPALRIGAGAMGNLLLLDDRTLAIARRGAILREVAVTAGAEVEMEAGTSMREMPHVVTAVDALLPATASSLVIGPAMLEPRSVGTRPGGDGEGAALPPVLMAAFGIEAGAVVARGDDGSEGASAPAGEARAQVRLVMGSAADAERAVAVVPARWESLESPVSGGPYAELMTLAEATVLADDPTVAAFDFDPGAAGNRWLELVMQLDLLPFAPGAL